MAIATEKVTVALTHGQAWELVNGSIARRATLDEHIILASQRHDSEAVAELTKAWGRTWDGEQAVREAAGFGPAMSETELRAQWGDR